MNPVYPASAKRIYRTYSNDNNFLRHGISEHLTD